MADVRGYGPPRLPRVFVASDGRQPLPVQPGRDRGILLRDLDLMTLIGVAEASSAEADRAGELSPVPIAVDLDDVEGLNADDSAARFLLRRLHIRIVMTRRASLAALMADAGGLGLVRIFGFDSTGISRALEAHPFRPGTGTVMSPGPVLAYLTADDMERLPRPIVAYGLIDTPDRARALLQRADSVVVSADCAAGIHEGA